MLAKKKTVELMQKFEAEKKKWEEREKALRYQGQKETMKPVRREVGRRGTVDGLSQRIKVFFEFIEGLGGGFCLLLHPY